MDKPAQPASPARPAPQTSLSPERRRALRAEAVGLIAIAIFILLYAILRYGAHINWSAH